MGRKALEYGAALIALYIVATNASNMGTLFTKGASGAATITHALQGH